MKWLIKLFGPRDKSRLPIHNVRNPIFKLFLHGLKGMFELKSHKPYNYYVYLFTSLGTFFGFMYFLKFTSTEFDQRAQPNQLVPKYVYRCRIEHFIYWQLSRLGRGKSTTFSYYEWDDNNKLMYWIDRAGNHTPVHTHNTIQHPEVMTSSLMEKHYPAPPQLHSTLFMYIKNMDNPYDLNNHLHHKSINPGDWIRALYYLIYRETGLTNRWRYDEYVSKPDSYYNYQKIKLAYRICKDRDKLYRYIDRVLEQPIDGYSIAKFFIWFM